jgi:UPF0042 nucleotide-binding protein
MQLVLLSGVSGSGKSVALKALEDAGYFCVDNLPAELVGPLADYARTRGEERVAISADARSRESLGGLPAIIEQLRANGIDVRVIFLDTDDESLLRRFSETRRPHPLAEGRTIAEAIAEERRVLSWLSEIGQRIDTSHLSPNQLRGWIRDLVVTDRQKLTLIFESFGFKGGAPLDADFVFDARCVLPNPHYEPQLRPLTGHDAPVAEFLERETQANLLVEDIQAFLQRWLPRFMLDQRASITVAVGCTGGRHRSIYIANQLAERFRSEYPVVVRHRDTQA